VAQLGNIDHGSTLAGYLGLLLLSASYISVGLFASSLTNNQIVAFLLAFFLCALFAFLFSFIGGFFTGFTGDVIKMFSLTEHYQNMVRGVIDSKDLIYFFTIILLGLFLTEWQISKR
jgi:ABC-2 type transport system permease protein